MIIMDIISEGVLARQMEFFRDIAQASDREFELCETYSISRGLGANDNNDRMYF